MKLPVIVLILFTGLAAYGQKKEMVELQRDVALLQDQMRTLQRSQDEKLAQLTLLIQQALEASNKANTSMAVLQNSLSERIGEQAKSMVAPVQGVGTKVDQMSDEFRSVREAVADLTARMGKLDAKLTDLNTAISTLRNPPAAPAPTGGVGITGAQGGASGPPPGASAEATYQSAYRDMQGGQMDLALQEFSDYLKWFPDTEYAPNAQFYMGDLYLRKGDAENAIAAFDTVLERYPENNKTPDARYMKGRALVQAGKPTAAAQEFREIIKRYPEKDVAAKAKAQLKALGYSTTGAPAAGASKKKKAR